MRIPKFIPAAPAGVLALLAFSAAPALATTETPVMKSVTSVTATTAVLHGELNPHSSGEAGEWLFLVPLSGAVCLEGEHFPAEPFGTALGDEKEVVEEKATNLEPNQNYTSCLVELGGFGLLESAQIPFKTLPAPPSIYPGTTKAANLAPFSATLEAKVNPNNEATTYRFEYATDEALTAAKTITGRSPLTGYGEETASVPTGNVLNPETTYYYRVLTENEQSEKEPGAKPIEGPVEHFTTGTPEKPVVIEESEHVTALNSAEPQFEAKINPNYQETEYHFEYATKASGEPLQLEGPITTVAGTPPRAKLPAVSAELLAGPIGVTGLQPGPTYYRVVATNATGTTAGPVQEFLALATPASVTGAAGAPTRTTVTLSGSIDPQGLPSTYHFAYIPQAAYEAALAKGAPDPFATALGARSTYQTTLTRINDENLVENIADYTAHPVAGTLEELAPGTTYVYALVAHNELGTTDGAPATFTTAAPVPPLAATGGASGVTQSSATLTGNIDTRGLPTGAQFEFSTTPDAGALLPATVIPGSETGTSEEVQLTLAGALQPATTYYYRLLATSRDGAGAGAEQSFTTPGFPAALAPTTALPFVPYTSLAELQAKEAKEGKASAGGRGLNSKSLTRGEKLAKALRVCRKERVSRRVGCERRAHKRFGPAGKKRTKK